MGAQKGRVGHPEVGFSGGHSTADPWAETQDTREPSLLLGSISLGKSVFQELLLLD